MEVVLSIKLNEATQTRRVLDALGAECKDGQVCFDNYSIDEDTFAHEFGSFLSDCVESTGIGIDEEIEAICVNDDELEAFKEVLLEEEY